METIAFQDHGQGIFSIRCTGKDCRNTLSPELLTQLVTALDTARHAVALKVLIIKGTPGAFLSGGESQYNEALLQGLFAAIASFPCPVIAAMQGDASGAGFLAGALCDFMVCSQSGTYRYTDASEGFFPTAEADALFSERFGRARATDFLYRTSSCTGRQLQEKRWSCPIVPSDQVETCAHALAANLARKSQSSLRLLKAHLTRDIRELVRRLTASAPVKPLMRSLSPEGAPVATQSRHIDLADGGDGVLLVKIRDTPSADAIAVVADVSEVFEQLNSAAAAGNARFGAVVLMSERDDFLPRAAAHRSAEGVLRLQQVLRRSSLPTIAVLPSQSSGLAWLIGELCDAAVYSREAQYSAADLLQSPALAGIAGEIFAYRFGGSAGRDIVLAGARFAGAELEQRLGPVLVAAQDQTLTEALKLAQRWAGFPLSTVAAWRKYGAPRIAEDGIEIQARDSAETVATGSRTELISSEPDTGIVRAPERIALESQVITATAHAGGVLVVALQDRQSKNLFSPDFVRGLQEVFRHIATTATYKVVVLTGYDSYFACGGTREALLAIQEGRAQFTDDKTYQATLACEIPVIAVMQGHGIGGGLSLGLFADFVLLSEESQYVSPYMGYGFTPGAGATLIVPEKLGHDLARETLLTAQEYAGSQLRDRGAPLPVYPRKQIHAAGMALAELIARQPRDSLIRLKRGLNRSIHERLEHNTRLEIAMHERTFVGQADTLKQIQTSFNPMDDTTPAKPISHASPNASLSGAQVLREIVAGLKQLLAQELHMKLEDVDEDTPFIDLGLDSITGVTWVRKINERYDTAIQATKVYSYPTLNKLGLYVRDEAQKTSASARAREAESSIAAAPIVSTPAIPAIAQSHGSVAESPARKARPKLASWRDQRAPKVGAIKVSGEAPQAIAVIGMAGQFPKSKTLEDYWENIARGRNCISEIPPGRWDIAAFYVPEGGVPGKTNSKWMGLLEEYDRFDPQFFEISPKEALSMDPQQRVFLQACWHAIEHAGYNPKALSAGKCGVFAGCGPGDYHLLSRDLQISALGFTGGDTSILAARVSYFLDLKGPCLSIETACSSSLVAIATACDNLVFGNCDLALAGGVYVMTGPELHIKTAQMGMLSPDGRCYTFDQRANGFVPGEGVGAVLLKRLADAERDGDLILGVIQGWGVNQDGKTNGITAPNPESQARLQQEVYDKYQIDPANIQLIEAHGTGTKLGDPIEIDALKQSFSQYTPLKGYCAIGSVKSNIGHCFTAAGVASTIKVLLALQHKQLPPTIHFERLNEHIDLDDSPFRVNDRLQSWEPRGAQRRQAAISGFGFGGTNAHIVIAEYSAPVSARPRVSALRGVGQVIVALSARTAEQLNQKALDLLEFVENRGRSADLGSIAYTLQVGREPMDARLAFLASSIDELKTKLGACVRDDCDSHGICRGRVSDSKEAMSFIRRDDDVREMIVERLLDQRKLSSLLELWVKGLAFDWNRLYGDARPARIHLPVYPFAKERYWIDSVEAPQGSRTARLTSALHPLLHTNTSNLQEYSFRSTFRGDEVFLEDGGIDGGKVLSAAACLEMARAAAAQVSTADEAAVVELHDVVWGEPFRVSRDHDIAIALHANEDETLEFEIHSAADGMEVVHCRGRAMSSPQCVAPRLDLARMEEEALLAGADALPVRFSLPESDPASEDYVLHPRLLDQILQGSLVPSALRQLRVLARCPQEGVARIEHAVTVTEGGQFASVDVDFCDRYGNVCVEIRGLSLESASKDNARETPNAPVSTGVEPISARPADAVEEGVSRAQLIQALKASLAQALYLKTSDISVDRPFIELGLDSIVGVEWVGELNKAYDLKITATKLYDYPNITELAAYVEKELQKSCVPTVQQHVAPVVESKAVPAKRSYPRLKRRARTARAIARGAAPAVDKIAVIGMSGRYPQAKNLEQFWDNLLQGRDSISEVPPSRWDVKRYYHPDTTRQDTVYCKWLGVLDEVDRFDPLFFKISPAEAKGMDPQHRLFLEESYKAFEDAGYATKALSHKKCGVYLGMIGNEYGSLVARSGGASVDLTGNNPAIGAARIAYFLNLKGPAISIDTACSSSLVAIHLACQGLLNHETDMALAGGVTVYLEPQSYFGMCQAGMLSPDGRCKTFDNSANGFVPGEGVGVVVLKRLQDALRDNDRIYGVILGSGINQDGKTNGITAPSVNSQIELGRELYAKHGIDPETISYVEAHGTGTKLGDPIELEALATVFKEKTSKLHYCALGSVKSNIGHTSGAAGVAGVQKVLLCMQHRMLVPTLNVTKENALFDFASSPFYVSKEKRPWDPSEGAPRRAGVSSFGFSGTNAHLVLEEYAPAAAQRRPVAIEGAAPEVLIALSARTPEQLRQKAVDLLQFLRSNDPSKCKDLLSIAYTLLTGRDAMDERLGLVVRTLEELIGKLQAYVHGEPRVAGICEGKVERDSEGAVVVRQAQQSTQDLHKLLELWVRGLDLDWHVLHSGAIPPRAALPTYPFARKRYWVDVKAERPEPAAGAEAAVLHPLVHRNISVLGQQGYCSTFSGDEPFLVGQRTDAGALHKVLPAVAYLEMARVAVEKAMPNRLEGISAQLRNIAWGRPLVAAKHRQVNIALFKRNEAQVDFEIYSLNQESQNPAEEIVHCQGHATLLCKSEFARLDLERLKTQQGNGQLLAHLSLPESAQTNWGAYVLHPSVLDSALHAAVRIFDRSPRRPKNFSLPFALDALHLEAVCPAEGFAWIRFTAGSSSQDKVVKLDIDLCDRSGKVCVALRGMAYEQETSVSAPAPEQTAQEKPTRVLRPASGELPFGSAPQQVPLVMLDAPTRASRAR